MSDYWVKPTIEQLQAELEWERGQEKLRRRRRKVFAVVTAAVLILASAAWIFPKGGIQHLQKGYALETMEAETEAAPEEEPEQDAEGRVVMEGTNK